jgi:hypothetical protein
MGWGWLRAIIDSLLAWLERRASKPSTIEDAKTPPDLYRRWCDYIDEQLRDKDGGDRPPK